MIDITNFQLKKFIGFLQDKSSESSKENESKKVPLFPLTEDYNHLKDLLRDGKKDMAKFCIEKGCCLNIKDYDYTFDGSPLHLAVSSEYSDIVQLLLEKGASVNSRNKSDETPLMLAAIIGNSQIIDMLLLKARPNNCSNKQGFSHFHIACMQNNIDLVKKCLVFDANINKPVNKKSLFWPGFTPLHFAVEFKCIETAKCLLKNGADITIQDNRGLTPLHLAFRKKNRVLIDIIISKHYYFASNPVDSEGLSHFHIACAVGRIDIVKDFLEKNINVENHSCPQSSHDYCALKFAINNESTNVLKYLLQCSAFFVERHNKNIIDCAYSKRNEVILNLLISSIEKDMVNIQCSQFVPYSPQEERLIIGRFDHMKRFKISEYSELHIAVLQTDKEKVNSILQIYHPSIVTVRDSKGKTPLHLAFETNQKDLVHQLISLHLKFDENPVDSNNLSHFHISCTTKNLKIVEDFIKKGVDVNMPINMNSLVWSGCTPLHFAMNYAQIDIVQLLLDNGADFTLKNAAGVSPYDLAIPYLNFISDDYDGNYGEWEFVEKMLFANERRKIDNFEDRGITLLHIAGASNDVDMIKHYASACTINRTIDEDVTQWAGCTALHLAAHYDSGDAVKTLLNYGADPTIEDCNQCIAAHSIRCIDERLFLIRKNAYDFLGISTFHMACGSDNKRVVEHFLKMGADVNERIPHNCDISMNDYEGQTPLHIAAFNGDPEIVKLLLEHGANVNARDCYFHTPLHFCRNKIVLKILLDYGADPEALNCEFMTALEQALYLYCEPDFITAVIETGWDIDQLEVSLVTKLDQSSLTVIAEHIQRLLVLDVYLNENSRGLYLLIIEKYPMIQHDIFEFKIKCDIELRSMKGIQIDYRTRLYDILCTSSSEMAVYSKNETFRKIVESEKDLRQKYPIYAYLIIVQFKKGLKRTYLVQEGKKSLCYLTNLWMGDLIFEIILQFMSDYEITYLNYAASGQNIFQ